MGKTTVTMIDSASGNEYSILLCTALHEVGANVILISPANRKLNAPIEFEIKLWMPTKDPEHNKFKKLLDYIKYQLKVFIHTMQQDKNHHVLHFQFFRIEKFEALLIFFLRILGIKMVFTAHNVVPHENSKIDIFFRKIIYDSVSSIIVHSQYIKNKLINRFKIDPQKVMIVPHGNFDHYVPEETIPQKQARSTLGLNQEDKVLLFFGYIREYKGVDLLLDAFKICSQQDEQLKLVIAGKPFSQELEDRYKKMIADIPSKDAIFFDANYIPFEKVPLYFSAADVIILPYKDIDHSGIIYLAYSFGLPIIATNVGDFSETIEHGKSGYLLEEKSAESLSDTILTATTDGEKLASMGAYAQDLSNKKYSWNIIAKNTRAIYEEFTQTDP